MGPICGTQPDPVHFRNDPVQPNPIFFEQTRPNPTQTSATDTVQHYRKFYVNNTRVPTQPNPLVE